MSLTKWLIAFNLGNVLDVITTTIGLGYGLREVNPLIKSIIDTYGMNAAVLFKLSLGLLLSFILEHRKSNKTAVFITLLIWLTVISNIGHIYVHTH